MPCRGAGPLPYQLHYFSSYFSFLKEKNGFVKPAALLAYENRKRVISAEGGKNEEARGGTPGAVPILEREGALGGTVTGFLRRSVFSI